MNEIAPVICCWYPIKLKFVQILTLKMYLQHHSHTHSILTISLSDPRSSMEISKDKFLMAQEHLRALEPPGEILPSLCPVSTLPTVGFGAYVSRNVRRWEMKEAFSLHQRGSQHGACTAMKIGQTMNEWAQWALERKMAASDIQVLFGPR